MRLLQCPKSSTNTVLASSYGPAGTELEQLMYRGLHLINIKMADRKGVPINLSDARHEGDLINRKMYV